VVKLLGRGGIQGGRGVGGVCAKLVLEGFLALHPHHVALQRGCPCDEEGGHPEALLLHQLGQIYRRHRGGIGLDWAPVPYLTFPSLPFPWLRS